MPNDKREKDNYSMLRRTVLQSGVATAAMGTIDSAAADSAKGFVTKHPTNSSISTSSNATTTELSEPTTVLVIRDCLAWSNTGVAANEEALKQLDFEYEVISSQTAVDQLPEYERLNKINLILIPSTQSTEYYNNLNSIWGTINSFVEDGGVLITHAGESGWPCSNAVRQDGSKLSFPRGVDNEYTFLPETGGEEVQTLQELTVSKDSHPIADGMDNSALSYWANDISSFGYFSGLPEEATEIFGLQIDPDAHPTYVEYPFGQGVIILTMQPPEWPFGSGPGRGGTQQLLLNELEYAVNISKQIKNPPTKGRIEGTATIAKTDGDIQDGTVYLIDPIHEPAVQAYINGDGSLPETEAETTVKDGEFLFDEIEPGKHLVLVTPENKFDSAFDVVSAPIEQTTNVSFELESDRPLSALDAEFNEIIESVVGQDGIFDSSTEDVANVHYDGAKQFDTRPGAKTYLDFALSATSLAMGLPGASSKAVAAKEIADYSAGTIGAELAEEGYHQYLAGRVADTDASKRADLKNYTDQILNLQWLVDLGDEYQSGVPTLKTLLNDTDIYNKAESQINDQKNRYEENVVREEPDEEFSHQATKEVLSAQAQWLSDNGLAPGIVVTPTGQSYVTRKTNYHRNHFEAINNEIQTTSWAKTASAAVSVAGTGVVKAGVGSVSAGGVGIPVAAIGSVAAIGGTVGKYAFRAHNSKLKFQLADAHAAALSYWVEDLQNAPSAVEDILNWVEAEAENPTLQSVSGSIESTNLGGISPPLSDTTYAVANKPEWPVWMEAAPVPTPQHRRIGVNTVKIKNNGSTTTEFKLTTVDTYGNGNNNGYSDAVSVRPDDNAPDDDLDPSLQPGETAEVDIEYSSSFHWNSPFNWHTMTTVLWMNGKPVDNVEDPYYIIPTINALPFSAQEGDNLDVEAALTGTKTDVPVETQSYRLTDASKAPREALTVNDWTDNVGDIVRVVDDTVSAEQATVSAQFDVGSKLQGVAFVLAAPPTATVDMHIRDAAGRHVGYEPEDDSDVVEIPGAEYNGSDNTKEIVTIDDADGSYTIEVEATRFLTESDISVSAYAVEIPQRDAIIGVSPTVTGTVIEPGAIETMNVNLSETGGQADIEITDISLGTFRTENGKNLEDVSVSLSKEPVEIAAGESENIEIILDAATSFSIPDEGPSRYSSELTVETATAGTTIVDTTIIGFDSDEGAHLIEAGIDVNSVSVDTISDSNTPEPPEDELTVTDVYDIDVTGEGPAVVSFPSDLVDNKITTAYQIQDGEWNSLDVSVGNRVAIELRAPTEDTLVIAKEETAQDLPEQLDGKVTAKQFNTALPDGAETPEEILSENVVDFLSDGKIEDVRYSDEDLNEIVIWWLAEN